MGTREVAIKNIKKRGPAWKKGDPSPNPSGRPLGQKNYATLYREALVMLAKHKKKEPDEIELEMLSNAIKSARAGNYRFYKDIIDRLYGTAVQKTDLTSGGEKIEGVIVQVKK